MFLSISYKQKLSNLWINCYSIPNWWEELAYGNGLPGPLPGAWCSALLQTESLLPAIPGMNSLVPGNPGAGGGSCSSWWTCAEFMPWMCCCPMGTGITIFSIPQVWKLGQEWAEVSGEQLKLWLAHCAWSSFPFSFLVHSTLWDVRLQRLRFSLGEDQASSFMGGCW